MVARHLNGQKFTKGSPVRFKLRFKVADAPAEDRLTLTNALIEIEFFATESDRAASSNRLLILTTSSGLSRTTNTATEVEVKGQVSGTVTATWDKEVFYRAWITPATGNAAGERISQQDYEGSLFLRS